MPARTSRRPPPPPADRRMRARTVRDAKQARQTRVALIVGAIALVVILAIPAYGYYRTFIQPPRTLAARVGETKYTMGDLVRTLRILDSASNAVGQPTNYSTAPFETLFNMVETELIRQSAPEFGIRVTPDDVDAYVKSNFYPRPPEGQQADPAQLEREYTEAYRNFLTTSRLKDSEYREVAVQQIYRDRMRAELSKRVPPVTEQVEVSWMRMSIDATDPTSVVTALRQGQVKWDDAFAQANNDYVYANQDTRPGYVGWVPRGAFPHLDPYLFGKDPSKPEGDNNNNDNSKLALNTLSDPISTEDGWYIIRVTAGPETRPVSDKMFQALANQALQQWAQDEWNKRDVEMHFDQSWYQWVVDQVQRSLPPQQRNVTPQPGGSGLG